MTAKLEEAGARAELVRAEGYRLLALALGHPDLDELRAELAAAPVELCTIGALGAHLDAGVRFEHTRLFAQSTPVSPYEGSYVRGDKGVLLGQLAALYELFGVKVSAEHEPPDHIGCELEFSALLAVKRALCLRDGPSERLDIVERARGVFMQEHLGRWAAPFAARLRETSEHEFFRVLADVLTDFVERDLHENGWRAERLFEGRSLPVLDDPDESELTCPLAERSPC